MNTLLHRIIDITGKFLIIKSNTQNIENDICFPSEAHKSIARAHSNHQFQ